MGVPRLEKRRVGLSAVFPSPITIGGRECRFYPSRGPSRSKQATKIEELGFSGRWKLEIGKKLEFWIKWCLQKGLKSGVGSGLKGRFIPTQSDRLGFAILSIPTRPEGPISKLENYRPNRSFRPVVLCVGLPFPGAHPLRAVINQAFSLGDFPKVLVCNSDDMFPPLDVEGFIPYANRSTTTL